MGLKKFIRQGSERFRIKPLYNHVQNKELREAVKMFEIDRKGKVWTKDLGKILRCIGWNPSESELEEARKELEVRVKGQILYHDLEHYVAKRTAQSMECVETDLQEAFKALGNKGDGKISVKNFRRFMTTLGEKMAPDEVEELLRDAKATEQDCIDYRRYKTRPFLLCPLIFALCVLTFRVGLQSIFSVVILLSFAELLEALELSS